MSSGYTVRSTCPTCFSAAFDRVWFDDSIGEPVKQTFCPNCTVPPTADPYPSFMALSEPVDPNNSEFE